MEISQNMCLGCMNELEADGTCSHCNYTNNSPYNKAYLPPKTMLDDNRYLVGKVLSCNGEGASYIAYDYHMNTKVVVREFMPISLCTRKPGMLKVFIKAGCVEKYKAYMQEFAELNKRLSRLKTLSNLVPAVDMFAENNTMYVVTNYVEGMPFDKFLSANNETLTWPQIQKLFSPLFTTLSLVHNSGIIHGGICPENIIVTMKGDIKLIGFCISGTRVSGGDILPDLHAGYAAVEQYMSSTEQGTWTDVYSIAAVIYRALTGIVPENSVLRRENDLMKDLSQMDINISSVVANVIMRGLRVNPETRIATITEFVTRLFEQPPEYVEHQKGATQTINVDNEPIDMSQYESDEDYEEIPIESKKNLKSTIIGAACLAVIVGIGLFFLIQMFSSGDYSSSNPATTTPSVSSATVSTNESTTTTSSTSASNTTENPYGTGAIMPNLIGLEYDSVIESLQTDFIVIVNYEKSTKYDEGIIIKQSIPENAEYDPAKKNALTVVVSTGTSETFTTTTTVSTTTSDSSITSSITAEGEEVKVPDYYNVPIDEYEKTLGYLGITYSYTYVKSNSVKSGYIVSSNIPAGTEMDTSKQTLVLEVAS